MDEKNFRKKDFRLSFYAIQTIKVFIFMLLFLFFLLMLLKFLFKSGLTPYYLRKFLQQFGAFSPFIFVVIYVINTIFIFPPIGILSITAGIAFGKVAGFFYLMLASMIGTSCTFFISRYLAAKFIKSLFGKKFEKFQIYLQKNSFWFILLARMFAFVPFEVLNYASGVFKIKFRDYFFATLLGFIAPVFIVVYFSDEISKAQNFNDVLSFNFLAASGIFSIAILSPLIYKTFKRKESI